MNGNPIISRGTLYMVTDWHPLSRVFVPDAFICLNSTTTPLEVPEKCEPLRSCRTGLDKDLIEIAFFLWKRIELTNCLSYYYVILVICHFYFYNIFLSLRCDPNIMSSGFRDACWYCCVGPWYIEAGERERCVWLIFRAMLQQHIVT